MEDWPAPPTTVFVTTSMGTRASTAPSGEWVPRSLDLSLILVHRVLL